MAKSVLSDDKQAESLKNSIASSLKNVEFPNKKTKINDYALIVWIDHFYKSISEQDNLFEITSKLDTISKSIEYLPLVEKIFESEENIEIFSQVANRLDTFRIADEYEDWDNIESFIKDVRERNGFDNYLK